MPGRRSTLIQARRHAIEHRETPRHDVGQVLPDYAAACQYCQARMNGTSAQKCFCKSTQIRFAAQIDGVEPWAAVPRCVGLLAQPFIGSCRRREWPEIAERMHGSERAIDRVQNVIATLVRRALMCCGAETTLAQINLSRCRSYGAPEVARRRFVSGSQVRGHRRRSLQRFSHPGSRLARARLTGHSRAGCAALDADIGGGWRRRAGCQNRPNIVPPMFGQWPAIADIASA